MLDIWMTHLTIAEHCVAASLSCSIMSELVSVVPQQHHVPLCIPRIAQSMQCNRAGCTWHTDQFATHLYRIKSLPAPRSLPPSIYSFSTTDDHAEVRFSQKDACRSDSRSKSDTRKSFGSNSSDKSLG